MREITERQKLLIHVATGIYLQDMGVALSELKEQDPINVDQVMSEAILDADDLITRCLEIKYE